VDGSISVRWTLEKYEYAVWRCTGFSNSGFGITTGLKKAFS
jgi:hypothetical protein